MDLETVLRWEGELDNARIRQLLGVKPVWASRLLAELIERLGALIKRPNKRGPIVWASPAPRSSSRQSPDAYLKLVASAPGGADALLPCLHDARIDLTAVQPSVFSAVVQAAKSGAGVKIIYRSMNHPEGLPRVVFPHALVRAPRRWHMRAWCTERRDFRDFVLSRVQTAEAVEASRPPEAAEGRDAGWTRMVDLRLIPHPSLTEAQQNLIAAEMFPGARAKRLRVRRSLAMYVLQDLRVALDVKRDLPPEFQLALASPQDIGDLVPEAKA
ncbi:WYL domain-containing protein [Roseateles asaccharophilus]|nr:WYL domain-containing protein [Roseateles asaccharophilus]